VRGAGPIASTNPSPQPLNAIVGMTRARDFVSTAANVGWLEPRLARFCSVAHVGTFSDGTMRACRTALASAGSVRAIFGCRNTNSGTIAVTIKEHHAASTF
jgi:hypothetical protein